MPLEMFDGRTGQRLIARLPITKDSYAVVKTDLIDSLKVYHPSDLEQNGYPALSPVLSTVMTLVAPMIRKRQELRRTYDQAYQRIVDREVELESADALESALIQIQLDLERDTLDNTRWMVDRPITCSSIMIGRRLTLHLPKTMFDEAAQVSAGQVQTIEIYNAPTDEE
ncbi:MAG TPA: hypothetical protein VFG56_01990 [Candidatus Saccharimonadales bacterium]|nr:hypothetical protein [Candidatus Saccharimonadales bacterium]